MKIKHAADQSDGTPHVRPLRRALAASRAPKGCLALRLLLWAMRNN